MEKLFLLFMIVVFAVSLTIKSVYADDGLQKDAIDMKNKTSSMMSDANSELSTYGGLGSN